MRHTFCGELLIKEQTQPTINLVLGKELGLQQRTEQSGGDSRKGLPTYFPPAPLLTHHLQAPLAPGTAFGRLSSDLESKVHQAGWRPEINPLLPWRLGPMPGGSDSGLL